MSVRFDTARRELGRQLGPYGVYTATSGSTRGFTCASGFESSVLPTDNQAYVWAFVPAAIAPRLRRVTATGVDGSLSSLTFDGTLGSAIANGTIVELSPKMPPVHESSARVGAAPYFSLQGALNLALRHLLTDDDTGVTLALVSGQRDYSLATWPWLDREERIVDVRVLDVMGTSYVPTSKRWELRPNGRGGATLHFVEPYRFPSGSYTARLVVRRPADTTIEVGGSWGDSTVGLVNESDEAPVELDQLIPVALAAALRSLRDRSTGAIQARYDERYQQQLAVARGVHNYDHSNDLEGARPAPPTPVAA